MDQVYIQFHNVHAFIPAHSAWHGHTGVCALATKGSTSGLKIELYAVEPGDMCLSCSNMRIPIVI